MSQLRRHGRELLDSAKRDHTPDAETRARLLRSLLEHAAATHSASLVPLEKTLSRRTKITILCLTLLLLIAAVYLAGHIETTPGP
jgi:hypothetical protein